MEILYTFVLANAVDGMTHVGVTEEIRDGSRIKVTGVYGKSLAGGFEPATHMIPFLDDIRGVRLIDLQEESEASGRPADKDWFNMDQDDVASWLADDPSAVAGRIAARSLNPEESRP